MDNYQGEWILGNTLNPPYNHWPLMMPDDAESNSFKTKQKLKLAMTVASNQSDCLQTNFLFLYSVVFVQ